MTKTTALNALSLADLTKVFNDIPNVKQIKKFSCSKVEAIAKIEAAEAANAPVKAEAEKKERAPRGSGIGARTVELLKSGMRVRDVFAALEGASTMNAVYWYSSKVKRGEL